VRSVKTVPHRQLALHKEGVVGNCFVLVEAKQYYHLSIVLGGFQPRRQKAICPVFSFEPLNDELFKGLNNLRLPHSGFADKDTDENWVTYQRCFLRRLSMNVFEQKNAELVTRLTGMFRPSAYRVWSS
jgi:hypothetical protein